MMVAGATGGGGVATLEAGGSRSSVSMTPNLHEERNLQSVQGCVKSESLETPFEADTVVFGTMFTVQSQDDPISVATMEISATPLAEQMDVEIYTKVGDYQGFENEASQWTQVVATTVTPARDGRGTIIPANAFSGFTMNPNELRSFFVSLKTSDLRYKRGGDYKTGQTFLSDGYLSMNVGIGIGSAGFGFGSVFPDRMFTGIIHYTHATDCDAPSGKSLVTYSFHARPKTGSASREEITNSVDMVVGDAVESVLNTKVPSLRDDHSISFEQVETVSSAKQGDCPGKWSSCVSVDSRITLSHRTTISGGQLQYLMFSLVPDVTDIVDRGTMQVEYFGYEPIKTSISVAYSGVPSGIPMDNLQKQFVEDVTAEYLAEQTVGLTNVAIVGTKITNQRGPGFKQNRLRSLQEGGSGGKWIELSMDVLGILDGPYTGNSNFFDIVDGAFRADDMAYIEDLKMGRHRPGSQVQGARGDYFVDINQILAKHPDDVDSSTPNNNPGSKPANGVTDSNSDEGSSTILGLNPAVFSIVCVGLIVIGILYVWYMWCWKSKGDADEAGETQVFVDSKGKRLKPETVAKIVTEQGGQIIPVSSQRGREKPMKQLSEVETSESSGGSRGKSGRKKPQTKTGARETKSSNARASGSSRNVRSSADDKQLQRGQSSKQWRDGTRASGSKSTKNSARLDERSPHRSSRNIPPPSPSRNAEQQSARSLSNQASPARSSRGLSSNAAAAPSPTMTRNSERSTRSMRSTSHTASTTSPTDARSSLRSSQASSSRGSSSALPPRPPSASEHTRSMRSSVHSRRQQASTHTRSSEHSSRSMRASN